MFQQSGIYCAMEMAQNERVGTAGKLAGQCDQLCGYGVCAAAWLFCDESHHVLAPQVPR